MNPAHLLCIPAAIVAAFLLLWLAGERDSRAGWVARQVVLGVPRVLAGVMEVVGWVRGK